MTQANIRINSLFERFAIWAGGAIIVLLSLAYSDQKTKVDKLEERVQFLYIDKVSKPELKETEVRIMTRIEAMQSDLIARLDLYFGRHSERNK